MRNTMLLLALMACGDKATESTPTTTEPTAVEPVCTDPTEVSCVDEMILDLSMQNDKTSEGAVASVAEGDDTVTEVDASAGGYNQASRNPWTYLKFSAEGVVKVEIDDESALESMDWDMALKRYLIRLNSGDSGPSCVGSAAMIGFEYEDLAEVPEGITWMQDDFYTDDCTLKEDAVGGAQTAMAPWWSYTGCVETTSVPFFIQLADGHVLKLRVEQYYKDDQEECDETHSVPPTAEGGYFRLRWRMIL